MSHARDCQMQEAIARVLRFQNRMPNTEAAGRSAMDTAASIMDVVKAAGLTLWHASSLAPEPPPPPPPPANPPPSMMDWG